MLLTKGQNAALKTAIQRYKNGERYTTIAGPAGSGKSTLVKFIVQALPFDEEDICYCAYTGKACQVLLKKGNKNVSTLHKLLYEHFPKPDGTFFRRRRIEIPYRLIIADECSMIPKDMVQELLEYNVYVIFLGDNFQLPPVDKDSDNHLLDKPHAVLTEILRQAQESEIIRLSMKIRNHEKIDSFHGKDVQILSLKELNTGMLTWADQILCGTNKTRTDINTAMRNLLGHEGAPEEGDKVICIRNYWDYCSKETADPLVNGTIGYLSKTYHSFIKIPPYIGRPDGGKTINILKSDFISDTGSLFPSLSMDEHMILTGDSVLSSRTTFRLSKTNFRPLLPMEFLYGYAITCHKAQGSEWDKVLVIEEKFPYAKEEHARWLYTACTRAADKLVLLR